MEDLSNEILFKIIIYFNIKTIIQFKNTNQKFNFIIKQNYKHIIYMYLFEVIRKFNYNHIKILFNEIGEMQNNIEIKEFNNNWIIYYKNIVVNELIKGHSGINISVIQQKAMVKKCSTCDNYGDPSLFSLTSYKNKYENKRKCYDCLEKTRCLNCNNLINNNKQFCNKCGIHKHILKCCRCFIKLHISKKIKYKISTCSANHCERCKDSG